ncbi:autotransporter-associated beta strand repeat-containing protein, partial [Brucella anthropi]|uniref:autotransporter-associated beta strand repeat-containing protein n=1 Tax=Brucella anthropi TaxID=529 RepID=UPI0023605D21
IISAGTLQIGSGDAQGAVTGDITNNGKLIFGRADDYDLASSISGTGGLEQAGNGILTLSGNNTFSGDITLSAGTVSIGSETNLGQTASNLDFNGGTLQITGTAYKSTSRKINWGNGGGGFDVADADNTFSINADLGAGGALSKSGAGTLILAGSNSYSGGTTIQGGTLSVAKDENLGNLSGNITLQGGTLSVSDNFKTNRTVTLTNLGGAIEILKDKTGTFSNTIGGSGSLTKTGEGTLILTAQNNY